MLKKGKKKGRREEKKKKGKRRKKKIIFSLDNENFSASLSHARPIKFL